MKKFLYSLRADLLFSEPVSNHTFVLRSVPLSELGQEPMRISLTCQPGCRLSETFDGQGNKVFLGRLHDFYRAGEEPQHCSAIFHSRRPAASNRHCTGHSVLFLL